jgi:hypothetical protein
MISVEIEAGISIILKRCHHRFAAEVKGSVRNKKTEEFFKMTVKFSE